MYHISNPLHFSNFLYFLYTNRTNIPIKIQDHSSHTAFLFRLDDWVVVVERKQKKKKKKVLVAARYKSCYYNTISCFKSVNVKIKKYN